MVPTLIPAQKSIDRPPAILSLIGDTPLVEVTRIDTGPCHLFLKLENQNPTGSIKDRVALAMVEAADAMGLSRGAADRLQRLRILVECVRGFPVIAAEISEIAVAAAELDRVHQSILSLLIFA
jgi:hypothetical protein